eukprot:g7485.t1
MGAHIAKPSEEFLANLKYRHSPTLDAPLTVAKDSPVAQVAKHFYSRVWEIRNISCMSGPGAHSHLPHGPTILWDKGGPFFHELFDYYKRYPKLQVEFLTQMLMQLKGNPDPDYEFKLHWVLMEFLFHGRNHVLLNETLCKFYEATIAEQHTKICRIEQSSFFASSRAEAAAAAQKDLSSATTPSTTAGTPLEEMENPLGIDAAATEGSNADTADIPPPRRTTNSNSSSDTEMTPAESGALVAGVSGAGGSSSSTSESSSRDLYHPWRIKATAHYTLVNLRDIADYGGGQGCSSGTPKWLVVEYHDAKGCVTFHRKIIRYKLYERSCKYVETVASEFGFPEPKNSELFVVYTDARKTAYRVEEGDDMLQPREERHFDLDWTDCYFIYKPKAVPLRNSKGREVSVPVKNGDVFFLNELPDLIGPPSSSDGPRSQSGGRRSKHSHSSQRRSSSTLAAGGGGSQQQLAGSGSSSTAGGQPQPNPKPRKSGIGHRHTSHAPPSPPDDSLMSSGGTPTEEHEQTDDDRESMVLYKGKNLGKKP